MIHKAIYKSVLCIKHVQLLIAILRFPNSYTFFDHQKIMQGRGVDQMNPGIIQNTRNRNLGMATMQKTSCFGTSIKIR